MLDTNVKCVYENVLSCFVLLVGRLRLRASLIAELARVSISSLQYLHTVSFSFQFSNEVSVDHCYAEIQAPIPLLIISIKHINATQYHL